MSKNKIMRKNISDSKEDKVIKGWKGIRNDEVEFEVFMAV
jgi:hypothetical protein